MRDIFTSGQEGELECSLRLVKRQRVHSRCEAGSLYILLNAAAIIYQFFFSLAKKSSI